MSDYDERVIEAAAEAMFSRGGNYKRWPDADGATAAGYRDHATAALDAALSVTDEDGVATIVNQWCAANGYRLERA